VEWFRGQRP